MTDKLTFMLLSLLVLFLQGCIHEYPSGSGDDPTKVSLSLKINLDMKWDGKKIDFAHESKGVRDPDVRIMALLSSPGLPSIKNQESFQYEPSASTPLLLRIPTPLYPAEYDLHLWCDFLHPETGSPIGFDISTLSDIRPLFNHGEVSDSYDARYYAGKLDLREYTGKWDTDAVVTIATVNPIGRFRLVAADYNEFLRLFDKEIRRGEKYSVTIEYQSAIPEAFSLTDCLPIRPAEKVTFTLPLDIIAVPGIELELASDCLFLPPDGMEVNLKTTILNSAKALVAQTSGINFLMQRGCITTLSGRFLTNFISGGLSVDNEWNGEITIDYDSLLQK